MSFMPPIIVMSTIIGLFLGIPAAHKVHATESRICTEADIRQALAENHPFDYRAEKCTNPGGVIEVRKGIRIRTDAWRFDGAGEAHLVWKGEGGCDKFPRNSDYAFFAIEGDQNVLKNFYAEGAPEGLHVLTGKGNTIENVTFPFICEDAITNGNKKPTSATETRILRSKFFKSTDKAIQTNGGQVTVEDCEFREVYRSIGACAVKADPGYHDAKPCGFVSHIIARRNHVYGCKGYGMRAAGKDEAAGGTLLAEYNTFTDCREPLHAEEEGTVIARHNVFGGKCKYGLRTFQSGRGIYGAGNQSRCDYAFEGNVSDGR